MAEYKEEQPSIEQTLKTFNIAADMFLAGKELAFQQMNEPPYLPGQLELADHVRKAAPDLMELTEWERSFIAVNGFMLTYALMARRANYQQKYNRLPDLVKSNLLREIKYGFSLDLDPDKVNFEWSLFSVSLVCREKEFNQAVDAMEGKRAPKKIFGFVSPFATELGPMPVVLKHREKKRTIWHEDIHTWQNAMGMNSTIDFDVSEAVDNPAIIRAAENEKIEDGDYDHNFRFLEGVLKNARGQMRIELAAALWSHEFPYVHLLDDPGYGDLQFAYNNLVNCIYSPAMNLTDAEKIQKQFDIAMLISKVDIERRMLVQIAKEGKQKYKGDKNAWDWVAARATVLPADYNPNLLRAVVLGFREKVENKPEFNRGIPLSTVLITNARRHIYPGSYGQGERIKRDRIQEFMDYTLELFNDGTLFGSVVDQYAITPEELAKARELLIVYASKSAPEGYKGKVARNLGANLKTY